MHKGIGLWLGALLVGVAFFLPVTALAEEISYYNRLYGILESTDGVSDVNLRQEPSTDATLVGTYRCGVSAQGIREEGDWLLVEVGSSAAGNLRGYVLKKYFRTEYGADHETGFCVARLCDARSTWDFAYQPEERGGVTAYKKVDGTLEFSQEGWNQLAAGTMCVVLGEVKDGEWTHVQIGGDQSGFVKTQALEDTELVSLKGGHIPRAGCAVARPPTDYAMPIYRYTDDTQAISYTLCAGDTMEYIANLGEWTQVCIANYIECAFVPTEYLTLYPYERLFDVGVESILREGERTIERAGLYTFSCESAKGSLRILRGGSERTYTGRGVYSMYLPEGAQVNCTDGTLHPILQDMELNDLSVDGVGAWDESQGNGRYLAGLHMPAAYWKQNSYILTVQEGKERGYYRVENLNQDAGISPAGEWIEIGPSDVVDLCLYYGQFIELRDAKLSYFSGNG